MYPVLSRRSGGISVGINLNPDKACNFDCIYCQVDRSKRPADQFVEWPQLERELTIVLEGLQPAGSLWADREFKDLPENKRKVTDIAFSGDGEPTTFKNFSEIIGASVVIKESLGFTTQKVLLITNATGLDRPDVKTGLEFLDEHQGEIWAKLDAGTPGYFKQIDHTDFPFERVLANILSCARQRPVVIQSCFMRVSGQGPSMEEIQAFASRLNELKEQGAQIRLVQVYTVARPPAYGVVSSLTNEEVDAIERIVHSETGLSVLTYYGNVSEGNGLLGVQPR